MEWQQRLQRRNPLLPYFTGIGLLNQFGQSALLRVSICRRRVGRDAVHGGRLRWQNAPTVKQESDVAVSVANLLQVVGVDPVPGKRKGKGNHRIPG